MDIPRAEAGRCMGYDRRHRNRIMTRSKRRLPAIRFLAVVAVAGWALYVSSLVRSWHAGAALHETLFAALVFAGPFTLVAFVGQPWRCQLSAVLVVVTASAAVAEGLAAIEEMSFVRRHEHLPADSPVVFHERWWPHASSYLYYDPSSNRLGGG